MKREGTLGAAHGSNSVDHPPVAMKLEQINDVTWMEAGQAYHVTFALSVLSAVFQEQIPFRGDALMERHPVSNRVSHTSCMSLFAPRSSTRQSSILQNQTSHTVIDYPHLSDKQR